jgi:hypothetical protein
LYASQARQQPMTQELLMQCLLSTAPLSVVMAEQLDALREWAAGRTVSAD